MCDCVERLQEKVRVEHDAISAFIEHGGCNVFSYTLRRRDGQPYKHRRSAVENWKFCPFCGQAVAPSQVDEDGVLEVWDIEAVVNALADEEGATRIDQFVAVARAQHLADTRLPWSDEWPTQAGQYWYYGTRWRDDKPRFYMAEVSKIVNGYSYLTLGQFIFATAGARGWWAPIRLPAKPEGIAG